MNKESKIIKLIGIFVIISLIGLFICIINTINANSRSKAVNDELISTYESNSDQVIMLPENRFAIVNNKKGSPNYGSINIYEYDNDKKTLNLISQLFQ